MRFYSTPNFLVRFLVLCIFVFSAEATSQEQKQEKDSLDQYSIPQLAIKFNGSLLKDITLAKVYAEKLLAVSIAQNDTLGLITSYSKFANLENQLGNTEKAIEYVDKAIFLAKKDSKYLASETYSSHTKGNILFNSGQYKKAFEYYTSIYDHYKKTGSVFFANLIALNIALIKNNLGDHESAVELLLESLANYENTPVSKQRKRFSGDHKLSCILGLSSAYSKYAIKNSRKKDSLLIIASDYNELGLAEATKKKNIFYQINFIIEAGIIDEERGNYEKALDKFNKASLIAKDYQEVSTLTALYYYKGRSYKKLQRLDEAVENFKKADSISEKNSTNYRMLQGAYYSLVEIYTERNDLEKVMKYQNLYIENERLNKQISQEVREDIHTKYDIDRLDGIITNVENSRFKAIIVISVLIGILIVFFLFYRRQKQKNKATFEKLLRQLEEKKATEVVLDKIKKSVIIDDEKVVQVLKALDKFEEKEWFRNKSCDLAFVAKKAKTNKTYLSKIIHEHKQVKFIDYIRNLRIDYALQRLKNDTVFRSYDIKSIAEESGFKSSDMFSRAFVKNTGIYPSYYIKNINKINSSEAA